MEICGNSWKFVFSWSGRLSAARVGRDDIKADTTGIEKVLGLVDT